jgi:LacI family transcriptional regulator
MTVSRVVRELGVVAPLTRNSVQQTIVRLGYKPDPTLSALASYRKNLRGGKAASATIAFLDCDSTAYSGIILKGAIREAGLLGYMVEGHKLDTERRSRCLSRILFHRGVRGLLFGPSDAPRMLEGWDWPQFAAVSLGALSHTPPLHSVAIDYFHGVGRACQWLRDEGCRRVGMAIDKDLEARTGHRWRGSLMAWSGETNQPFLGVDSVRNPQRVLNWVRREKIDGVITIHPEVSRLLSPKGIKVAFLNDFQVEREAHLSLDPEEIGAEGVRLLHHLLLRHEFGFPIRPKAMLLQGTWKEPKGRLVC